MSLREDLSTALGLLKEFASGKEKWTEEELQGIDQLCKEMAESLKITTPKEQKFPKEHWVFKVKRSQYAYFSVPGDTEEQAWNRAMTIYHGDIEGLRFTWDTSNPLELTPLELERVPHD